jgi:hypothetical protein
MKIKNISSFRLSALIADFYPYGVHSVALRIPLKYTRDRNWEFIGVTFILSVQNMFRPLRALLKWNTTNITYIFSKNHRYYNGSVVLQLLTHIADILGELLTLLKWITKLFEGVNFI